MNPRRVNPAGAGCHRIVLQGPCATLAVSRVPRLCQLSLVHVPSMKTNRSSAGLYLVQTKDLLKDLRA